MKIEELVPTLELCKRIPAVEFEDSALVYFWLSPGNKYIVIQRSETSYMPRIYPPCPCGMKYFYPAPTLQEILAALPPYGKNEQILACCVPDWADFDARVFGENWRVGYTGDCSINDKNPATAALNLWLKLKGIEE